MLNTADVEVVTLPTPAVVHNRNVHKIGRRHYVCLRLSLFKTTLFRFFLTYSTDHANANVLEGHIVYFGLEQSCYSLVSRFGNIFEKRFLHLDAVGMIYHLYRILEADTRLSIAIRSADTDVFILLLYHVTKHTSN